MKTIFLFCASALLASGALAQTASSTSALKEGIMKKGGKVWLVKPMQEDEILANGLIVDPNGTAKTPDGKTIELGNGDCVGSNGKVVGLNEKKVEYALVKNDKMWILIKLDSPLTTSDGTSILPDGTMIKSDGSTVLLKNNEIVNIASSKTATWRPEQIMATNR